MSRRKWLAAVLFIAVFAVHWGTVLGVAERATAIVVHPADGSKFYDVPRGISPWFEAELDYDTDGINSTSMLRGCKAVILDTAAPEDPRWTLGGSGAIEVPLTGGSSMTPWNNNGPDLRPLVFPSEIRPVEAVERFVRIRCSRVTVSFNPYKETFDKYELSSAINRIIFVPRPNPQCADGADNDGDGAVDGSDPDCVWEHDNTEAVAPRSSLAGKLLRLAGAEAAERSTGRRVFFDDSIYYHRVKCRRRTNFTGVCDATWIPSRKYVYVARVHVQIGVDPNRREGEYVLTTSRAARAKLRCVAAQKRCRYRYLRTRTLRQTNWNMLKKPAPSIIYDFYSAHDDSFENPFEFDD